MCPLARDWCPPAFLDPRAEAPPPHGLQVRLKCFPMFYLINRLNKDLGYKYTPDWTIWSWKFQKFSAEGLPEPFPQTLPPLFLRLRPQFGLRPQISGASCPRFGLRPIRTPQLLKLGNWHVQAFVGNWHVQAFLGNWHVQAFLGNWHVQAFLDNWHVQAFLGNWCLRFN